MSKQLMLCLLAMTVSTAMGQCPTRPTGGSKSNSGSQQAKECEVPNILECSSSTVSPSIASSTSPSTTQQSTSSSAATVSSSSEPCPCILITSLVNMKYMLLNSSQQVIFESYLAQIRIVLVDVTIMVNEKVSEIAYIIQQCFDSNKDIKKLLKNEKIDTWGRVYEFLLAGVSFDSVYVDSLITPLDTDGNCKLTNAITSATAGDVCGTGSTAQIQVFVGNLKKITRKQAPGYDKGRKLGWLKKAYVKNFYVTLTSQQQNCVKNVVIFAIKGTFGRFINLCSQFEKSSSMGTTILNGTAAQCVLIQSLSQSLNSNSVISSTSPATMQEANNFMQNLTIYFSSTTDIVLRLKFFASQFSMLTNVTRTLLRPFPILVTNFDCDVADLVATSHFWTDDQAGNITFGPPSLSYPETCMVDSVYNSADVWDAVNSYYSDSGNSTGFNSYKQAIKNCVYSLHPGDFVAKANCVKIYLSGYNSSSITPSMRSMFLNTQIVTVLVETVTTVVYGTFASFITNCGC